MKITLLTTLCGPNGNAYPGTVLDVTKEQAEQFFKTRSARPFDPQRDKAAKRGLVVGRQRQNAEVIEDDE